jgi:DnaJ-class molecular chaperone
MDHTQDLYTILGVGSDADAQVIKAAYRTAARRFHPDVNS